MIMWNRISGKKVEKQEASPKSHRHYDGDSYTPRQSEPDIVKERQSSRRKDDRDSNFHPYSTSYSSTSTIAYPNTAGASVASSIISASGNSNDSIYKSPGLVRNQSMADKLPRTNAKDPKREGKRNGNRPSEQGRKRSTSRERKSKEDLTTEQMDRDRRKDKKDKRKRDKGGGNDNQYSVVTETSRGPADFSGQVGNASFQQFPGQYDGGTNSVAAERPLDHNVMSSHVQDQFPGQFPSAVAAPYRPPGPGLAAEYYGDAGQSVAEQPGYRVNSPSLIIGAEPHLQPALVEAAPPPEPSASGGVGAAASFFSGEFDAGTAASVPAQPASSAAPNRPSMPISTSSLPALGSTAMGAATGYIIGHHASQGHSANTGDEHPADASHGPSLQTQNAYHSATSKPAQPGTIASHVSGNLPYEASAIGATSLAGASTYNGNSDISSLMQSASQPTMQYRHRPRGPLDAFVDFFKDPEGVAQFEEYTEFIGVCRNCFEPGSTPKQAPRRHHFRRRRSDERIGRPTRVEKSGRQSSDDERDQKRKNNWIAAGLGSYGLGKLGEGLFRQNKDFDDTYSVKSGRHSPEVRKATIRRHDVAKTRRAERSQDQTQLGLSNIPTDGPRHSVIGESSIPFSPAKKRYDKSNPTERKVSSSAMVHDDFILDSESRRHDRSQHGIKIRSDYKPGDGSSGARHNSKREKKGERGFFSFGSGSSSSSVDLSRPRKSKRSKATVKKDSHGAEAALLGLGAAAAALTAAGGRSGPNQQAVKSLVGRKETKGRNEEQTPEEAAWEDESEGGSIDSGLAFGGSQESLFSNHEQYQSSRKTGSGSMSLPASKQSLIPDTDPNIAGASALSLANHPTASPDGYIQYRPHERSSPPLQHVFPVSTSDPDEFDFAKENFVKPSDMNAAVSLRSADAPLHQPQPRTPISTSMYSNQVPYAHGAAAVTASEPTYETKLPLNDMSQRKMDRPDLVGGSRLRRRDTSPAKFDTQPIERHPIGGARASAKENSSVKFDLPSEDEAIHLKGARRRTSESQSHPLVTKPALQPYTEEPRQDEKHRQRRSQSPDSPKSFTALQSMRAISDKSWSDPAAVVLPGAAIATAASSDRSKDDESKEERRQRRRRERRRDDEADDARRERRRKIKEIDHEQDEPGKKRSERAEDDETREQRRERRRKEREQRERQERREEECSAIPAVVSIADEGPQKHTDQDDEPMGTTVRQEAASKQSPVHQDYGSFFAPTDVLDRADDQDVKIFGANADADIELDYNPTIVTVEPKGFRDLSDSPGELTSSERDTDHLNKFSFPWPIPKLRLLYPTPPSSRSSTPIIAPRDAYADDTAQNVESSPAYKAPARISWASDPVKDPDADMSGTHHVNAVPDANSAAHTPDDRESTKDLPPTTPLPVDPKNGTPAPLAGGDDFEFAAALAAGAEIAGFDPSIVTGNSEYHRRQSPPGSDETSLSDDIEQDQIQSGRKGRRKSKLPSQGVDQDDQDAGKTEMLTQRKNTQMEDADSEQLGRSFEDADEDSRTHTSKVGKAKKSKRGRERSLLSNVSVENQDTAVLSGKVERQNAHELQNQDASHIIEEDQPINGQKSVLIQRNSTDAVQEPPHSPDVISAVKTSKPKKGSLWDRVLGKSKTESPESSTQVCDIREHASGHPGTSAGSHEGTMTDPLQAQIYQDTPLRNNPEAEHQTSERPSTDSIPGRVILQSPSRDGDRDHTRTQTPESFLGMRPEPPPPPDAEEHISKSQYPRGDPASLDQIPDARNDKLNQRPSEIRVVDTPQSPKTIASPTAVPVHFRRPVRSHGSSARSLSQTSLSRGQILEGSPTSAKPRPRSTEFKSSKEFRPLWLVERHGSRQDSVIEEAYPSLPSSRSSSRSPSPPVVHRKHDTAETLQPALISDRQPQIDEDSKDLPTSTTAQLLVSSDPIAAAPNEDTSHSGSMSLSRSYDHHAASHLHSIAPATTTLGAATRGAAANTLDPIQSHDASLEENVATAASGDGPTSVQEIVPIAQVPEDIMNPEALPDTSKSSTSKRKKDKKKKSKENAALYNHNSSIRYNEGSQHQAEDIGTERSLPIDDVAGEEPRNFTENECDSDPAHEVAEPMGIYGNITCTNATQEFEGNALPRPASSLKSKGINEHLDVSSQDDKAVSGSDSSQSEHRLVELSKDEVPAQCEDAARHEASSFASDRAHRIQASAGTKPSSIQSDEVDNASIAVTAAASSIKPDMKPSSSAVSTQTIVPEIEKSHGDATSAIIESQADLDDEFTSFGKANRSKEQKYDRESTNTDCTKYDDALEASRDLSNNRFRDRIDTSHQEGSEVPSHTAETDFRTFANAKKTKKEKKKKKSKSELTLNSSEQTEPNSSKSDGAAIPEPDETSAVRGDDVTDRELSSHGVGFVVSSAANNLLDEESRKDAQVDTMRTDYNSKTKTVRGASHSSVEDAARERETELSGTVPDLKLDSSNVNETSIDHEETVADQTMESGFSNLQDDSRTLSKTPINGGDTSKLAAAISSENSVDKNVDKNVDTQFAERRETEDSGVHAGSDGNLVFQEPDNDDSIEWAPLGKKTKKKARKSKQRDLNPIDKPRDAEDGDELVRQPSSVDPVWQGERDRSALPESCMSFREEENWKKQGYPEASNEKQRENVYHDCSATDDILRKPPRTGNTLEDVIISESKDFHDELLKSTGQAQQDVQDGKDSQIVSEENEIDGLKAFKSRVPGDALTKDEQARSAGSSSDYQDVNVSSRPTIDLATEGEGDVQTAVSSGSITGKSKKAKKAKKKNGLVRQQSAISEDLSETLSKNSQTDAEMPVASVRSQDSDFANLKLSLLAPKDSHNDARIDDGPDNLAIQVSKQGTNRGHAPDIATSRPVDADPGNGERSQPQTSQGLKVGGESDAAPSARRADDLSPGLVTDLPDHATGIDLEEPKMARNPVNQAVRPPETDRDTQFTTKDPPLVHKTSENDNSKTHESPSGVDEPSTSSNVETGTVAKEININTSDPLAKHQTDHDAISDTRSPQWIEIGNETGDSLNAERVPMLTTDDINQKHLKPIPLGLGLTQDEKILSSRQDSGGKEVSTVDADKAPKTRDTGNESQRPHTLIVGEVLPDAIECSILPIRKPEEPKTGRASLAEASDVPDEKEDEIGDVFKRPIESPIPVLSKKGKKKQKKSKGLSVGDSLIGETMTEVSPDGRATEIQCQASDDMQIKDASAVGQVLRSSSKARGQDEEASTEIDRAEQNAPDPEPIAEREIKTVSVPSFKTGKARKDKKKAKKNAQDLYWAEETVKATKDGHPSLETSPEIEHVTQDVERTPKVEDAPTHPIISPIRGPQDIPPSLTFNDIIEPSEVVEPQSTQERPNGGTAQIIGTKDTVGVDTEESIGPMSKGKKGKKTKKSKSPKVAFEDLALYDRYDEQPIVADDIGVEGRPADPKFNNINSSEASIEAREGMFKPRKSVQIADEPPEVLGQPAEKNVPPDHPDKSAADMLLSGASADLLDQEEQREYEDKYLEELKRQLSPPEGEAHSLQGAELPQGQDNSYHKEPDPSSSTSYDKHQRSISGLGPDVEQQQSSIGEGVGHPLPESSEIHQHPTALEQIKEENEPHTIPTPTQNIHNNDDALADFKPTKKSKKGKSAKKRDPVIWEDATATPGVYETTGMPGTPQRCSPALTKPEEAIEKEARGSEPWDILGSPSIERQSTFRDDSNDYFGLRPSSQAEEDFSQSWLSNDHPSAEPEEAQTNLEYATRQFLHSRGRAFPKTSASGKRDKSPRASSIARDVSSPTVSRDKTGGIDAGAGAAGAGLGAAIAAISKFGTNQPDKDGPLEEMALEDPSHLNDRRIERIEQVASADTVLENAYADGKDTSPRRAAVDSHPIDRHHIDDESKAAMATGQRESASLRDSGIHIPDTAPIATSNGEARPFRDSGYPEIEAHPVSENLKQRANGTIAPQNQAQTAAQTGDENDESQVDPSREVHDTFHADDVSRNDSVIQDLPGLPTGQQRSKRRHKGRRSSATYDSDDSADSGFDIQRRRRRQALFADEAREPSPVSSTTKDRSSGLFDSSPSTRQIEDVGNQADYCLDSTNAPRYGIKSADQHSPFGQKSPLEVVAPDYTSQAAGKPQESKSSIFGGPMPTKQLPSEGSIFEENDRGPRQVKAASERSMDNIPVERKGKREAADIGLPESGAKARRTSLGWDSPYRIAEEEAELKAVAANSADEIKPTRRLSNQGEGHENIVGLDQGDERPKERQMSNQSTLSNMARDGEWRRQNIGSPDSIHAIIRTPDQMRSSSGQSFRSSGTPPLRRMDRSASGDLRGASKMMFRAKTKEAEPVRDLGVGLPSSSTYDPLTDKGKARGDMADVYEGWGDVRDQSPMSPTRPPSMRKRQSMHFADLEQKLEQLAAEHRSLQHAKSSVDRRLEEQARDHSQQRRTYEEAMQEHKSYLAEKDLELERLHGILDGFKNQVAELTAVNEELHSSREVNVDTSGDDSFTLLASQHKNATRELEELREQHTRLANDHEDIVEREIAAIREEKDHELQQLQDELEDAKDQIRSLQQQILASRPGEEHIERDEDYFEAKCTALCQHVQQWVLRFSKLSDGRACRLIGQLGNDNLSDLFDDAILDGSEADDCLQDRIKRRDIFMSVVMSRIFEHIFARYLFGLDREHRKKLKDLDQTLMNNGAPSAVQKWRSTTLGILSSRQAFREQREDDTEGVVDDIYKTLAAVLPPKKDLAPQIKDSLRRVVTMAVDLHIEMRLQRAEYQMLPPLKPQFDPDTGDLIRKVPFNATMMNERSGDEAVTSNEQLQEDGAVVKMVLFPLVIKSTDDEEQVVVCPAQVLTSKDKMRGEDTIVRDGGAQSTRSEARSEASFAANENMQMGGAMF